MSAAIERLNKRGELKGHNGWVTAIATCADKPDLVLSASRDKTILVWNLTHDAETFGLPVRRLIGHNHYVSDVAITSDGLYALSGSWDGTLRLWELASGECKLVFIGHSKDVLSVAFSNDNRQIISASRDKTIKLWNTLAKCKYTFQDNTAHKEWVSCVRYSPGEVSLIVSAGWDKLVKVWNGQNTKLNFNLVGHEGYINTLTISPDGSLCASGGKDGKAFLWDINDGRHLSTLEAGDVINALVFSPVRYWLCAATASGILVWDLESKVCLEQLTLESTSHGRKTVPIQCISLCWSPDGSTLYAGYTDNVIRCYQVSRN